MTEANSWQDILRRSGFIHDAAKGDHVFFGLAVGGQYNSTNPTLTNGDWSTLQVDSSGRVKCILDGATINLGGDLDVDVSAFTNSAGINVEGAMTFTNDESLAAKTEIWQGVGGWDKTADMFRAFPISTDAAAMPAAAVFVGVGGEYRATAATYTDGDATILQTDINGNLNISINDGTTKLDVLTQDSAYGTVSKGLAVFGKYESTPTTYSDGDAVPVALDENGRILISDVDIQIGAVELKDSTSSTRAVIKDASTFVITNAALGVADANALAKLVLINDKLVTGTVIGDVNAIQSGTWNITDISGTVSLPTGAATETTLALIKTAVEGMDGDFTTVFDADADETAQAIKSAAGTLVRLTVDNADTSAKIYVQLFDVAVGDVTVGTTTPKYVIPIPAGAMYDDKLVMDFATAITYAVTATPTGLGATGATITLSAGYK